MHYWEIGGSPATRLVSILDRMNVHFEVERHCRVSGNPEHRLFVLSKRPG